MLLGAQGLIDQAIPSRRQCRSRVGGNVGGEAPEHLRIETDRRRGSHTYTVGECRPSRSANLEPPRRTPPWRPRAEGVPGELGGTVTTSTLLPRLVARPS